MPVFTGKCRVCMADAIVVSQFLIRFRFLIRICDDHSDGHTRRLALENAGKNRRSIFFLPRGRDGTLPRTTPCEVSEKIFFRELYTSWAAIDDHAECKTV